MKNHVWRKGSGAFFLYREDKMTEVVGHTFTHLLGGIGGSAVDSLGIHHVRDDFCTHEEAQAWVEEIVESWSDTANGMESMN